ncbi:MAG: DUF3006 domain-containing protein [Clostridia bacterium]
MQLIVDRIEGDFAICEKEDMSFTQIKITDLPKGTKQGSFLNHQNGVFVLDEKAEQEARERILEKQAKLFKK